VTEIADILIPALPTNAPPAPTPDAVPTIPAKDRLYRVQLAKITVVGLDTSHKVGEHELWDERIHYPMNEDQILSFMAVGIRVPVVCLAEDGKYLVVDGRRRVIEGREASRRLVALGEAPLEVWVHFGGKRLSHEMALLLSVELNERRTEDPHDVKCRKAARLYEAKIDVATIARAFGKTKRAIYDWLALDYAAPDVKAAVELKMISASAGAALSRTTDTSEKLDALILEGRPSRQRAAAIARGSKGAALPKRAVRAVLKAPAGTFSEDFLRGILFGRGELLKDEVREIMNRIPPPLPSAKGGRTG